MTDTNKPDEGIYWLEYFFANADFGPAHENVMAGLMRDYEHDTGRRVPDEYREGYLND